MSSLYDKLGELQPKEWREYIDILDHDTMNQVLIDTKWMRDIITWTDFEQTSEPLLKPSNPIEKLIEDTFNLEIHVREAFEKEEFDDVLLLLSKRKEGLSVIRSSLLSQKMKDYQDFITESLKEFDSHNDEMIYYHFLLKFGSGEYRQAVDMKDAVVRHVLNNREEVDGLALHHLLISLFIVQGTKKAFEFLPTLEEHFPMDIETWILSLFLKSKMKVDVQSYISETVQKMKQTRLDEKQKSEIQEWIEGMQDLFPGKENKALWGRIFDWIDPVKHDAQIACVQELGKEKSVSKTSKSKTVKASRIKVKVPKETEKLKQEEKDRIREEQSLKREAARIRKAELEAQRQEQEALKKEQEDLARKILGEDRAAMKKEDKRSKKANAFWQKQERFAKNMAVWSERPVTYRAPQVLYKEHFKKDFDYLISFTEKGSKELFFQKIKPFPETVLWKQLRSSHWPKNSSSQALLKILRTEHAVEYREIQGTFYAIYRYNPFSVFYEGNERIVPGTLGFAGKPLREGGKLQFVVIK